MLNSKQFIVIGAVVVLMAVLYSLDIKGLVKPEDTANTGAAANAGAAITVESVSATAKQGLSANFAKQITDLEASLKGASGADRIALEKELARKWDDVNQPAPAAMYMESVAMQENKYENWLKAGDHFTDAYQATQDSVMVPALVHKAIDAYKKADTLKPNTIEVKTGLGIAYVSGTETPMQGIQLLLDVVKQYPKNIKANMNLGLFSMKSGQYAKAVDRFKTVIEAQPGPEAWFYLASSYESLGNKPEAIAAYQKAKELAAEPALTRFVDNKIQELRK